MKLTTARHLIIAHQPGRFFGWPANNGIWSWGSEILVGLTRCVYQRKEKGHSFDESHPQETVQARSLDGGETWNLEEPDFRKGGELVPCPGFRLDHPDFAMKIRNRRLWASYDRGRSWEGPYAVPDLGFTEKLTSRTDYLVNGKDDCFFFFSAEDSRVDAGSFCDRAFSARTRDGGKSLEFQGWMTHEPYSIRSVMSSTVRLADGTLVSVLRRREKKHCWLDAVGSADEGKTWENYGKVSDTQAPGNNHNGNPPSLSLLPDGRLVTVYGFRSPPYGMRARISHDGGKSWGEAIILRDDAATWDIGYPRTVVRPDGKVVSIYYYTTPTLEEQQIAATIWDPSVV